MGTETAFSTGFDVGFNAMNNKRKTEADIAAKEREAKAAEDAAAQKQREADEMKKLLEEINKGGGTGPEAPKAPEVEEPTPDTNVKEPTQRTVSAPQQPRGTRAVLGDYARNIGIANVKAERGSRIVTSLTAIDPKTAQTALGVVNSTYERDSALATAARDAELKAIEDERNQATMDFTRYHQRYGGDPVAFGEALAQDDRFKHLGPTKIEQITSVWRDNQLSDPKFLGKFFMQPHVEKLVEDDKATGTRFSDTLSKLTPELKKFMEDYKAITDPEAGTRMENTKAATREHNARTTKVATGKADRDPEDILGGKIGGGKEQVSRNFYSGKASQVEIDAMEGIIESQVADEVSREATTATWTPDQYEKAYQIRLEKRMQAFNKFKAKHYGGTGSTDTGGESFELPPDAKGRTLKVTEQKDGTFKTVDGKVISGPAAEQIKRWRSKK